MRQPPLKRLKGFAASAPPGAMAPSNPRQLEPQLTPTFKWLPYLLLALAVLLTYGNVYDNAFLFDDTIIIVGNDYLKDWKYFGGLFTTSTTAGSHATGGFYRPLQMILYFFIYRILGPDPFLFHLLNNLLHAANACLLFALGRRLRFNFYGCFCGSLIWALHPLHTEAITYASGTAEPLFSLFLLAGLIILLPVITIRRMLLTIPLFGLALLSKEAAVVFPALLVISLFLISPQRFQLKTYLKTWPLWLLSLAFIIWRMHAPGFDGPQSYDAFYKNHGYANLTMYAGSFAFRLFTFLATLPSYLRLLVWPAGLHMERAFPIFVSMRPMEVDIGLLMVLAAGAQVTRTIWSLKKIPAAGASQPGTPPTIETEAFGTTAKGLPLSWGLMWFAVVYFPDTGLILPMNSQFLEHWMYLPTMGLFLGIAETVVLFLPKTGKPRLKQFLVGAALLLAVILSLVSFEQNAVWFDPFTFYGNIFRYGEVSPRAHNNLALAYMDKNDIPASIIEFEKAIKLSDTYPETRHNLALALLQLPDPESEIPLAIESLNRSIELDPNFYRSYLVLAQIYDHLGDHLKADELRRKAAQILGPNFSQTTAKAPGS